VTTSPSNPDKSSVEVLPTKYARRPWWRLPLGLGFVLIAILLFKGIGIREIASDWGSPAASSNAGSPTADRVSITVDFGGERKPRSNTIPWTAGMTVHDLLASASVGSLGTQGTGAATFLVMIDGVKNAGAGGRNWMYSVNGQRGDRSFAIYELHPGDHVLWSFAPPQ
jgi:hypothetical protein